MAVEYSLNKPIDELYTMPNRAQIHKTKTSDLGHGLKMKHHATNTNQPINPIDVAINNENNVVKSSVKSKLRKKIFVNHYKYSDQLINTSYDQYKEKSNTTYSGIP